MEALRTMIVSIAALVIISGAVDLLSSGSGIRSFARFACGLLLMLAMLTPLYGLLNVEPERLMDETQETMSRAESMQLDDVMLRQQTVAAAEAAGARVTVSAIVQNEGQIEVIEMTVIEGDESAARQAVCSVFGLRESQIAFQ